MKFLGGIFESKAVSKSGAVARATAGSLVARSQSYALGGDWDVDRAVKDGYERVLMVFRCVDAIASAQADIPIIVRRGDLDDGEIVEYKDINRLLNRRPNKYEDSWQFRYRLSSQLLLSRRGAFIEIIRSKSGGIAELHLLPPGEVEPIPGQIPLPGSNEVQKFVDGYKIRRSDGVEEELAPEQVIWLKTKPHPTDPYMQMTPLVAAGLAIETDFYARLFNRNFLANDGRPGMLVSIRGQLGMDDAAEIKRRFSGGYSQAGQTTVIEADGVDIADLAANPRDIQWAESIRGSGEDIRLAFGTPESVLGNASGRTFDNADAEFEVWYIVTVKQHCNAITRPLDRLTLNEKDDDRVTHDFSKVEVLQRAEQKRRDTAAVRFSQGLTTLDEYLEEAGKKPLNVPASRVHFLPNGLIAAKNPEDEKTVVAMQTVGSQPPPDPSASARAGALQGSREGQRTFENIIAARALRLSKVAPKAIEAKSHDMGTEHPYLADRMQLEGTVEGVLTGWSDRQEKVITERLSHTKVRKGTRHWDGEVEGTELKAIDPTYVVELEKWSNEVRDTLHFLLMKSARREAGRVANDMKDKGLVELLAADGKIGEKGSTLARLVGGASDLTVLFDNQLAPVLDMIEKAAANQSRKIIDTINEMDADGASITEMKNRVREMMSTRSSWHKQLSIVVTTATIEGVRDAVYSKAGKYVEKEWNSVRDERTRHSHFKATGQRRPADKPFKVGASLMEFPGDLTAPIGEVANCRCWLNWKISEAAVNRRNRRTVGA